VLEYLFISEGDLALTTLGDLALTTLGDLALTTLGDLALTTLGDLALGLGDLDLEGDLDFFCLINQSHNFILLL
jgi:hypothetical protein